MPSNTSASMYGGDGRRGRPSVTSLEGLRNVMRNDTERDSAPATSAAPAAPVASPAPAAPDAASTPAAPADDKQTLRGLNNRLSGYLDRVKQLKEENENLKKQIDEILAKRKAPEGRDWDKIEEPLENLKQKIRDITMDNANLLMQIDNTKLANDDLKKKLENEKKARMEVEKDVEDVKKTTEDTKLNSKQTKEEIDMVKKELDRLQEEHNDEVKVLREKIQKAEVNVEIISQNSNLSEIITKIRIQYDELAEKNRRETEQWYQGKFENIKVVEAQNTEALQSGQTELKDYLKQKQTLEVKIQSLHSTIQKLEETLMKIKIENGQRLIPLNQMLLRLEAELKDIRSLVERQVESNRALVGIKMKLEAEIKQYQQLIHGITTDAESLEGSLEDVVHNDQQKPENKVPKQQGGVKEEAPVKQ